MLVALLQAKNEERYLPGWLDNVTPFVDGFIAYDDGSTDATADILAAHPKCLELIRQQPGDAWRENISQVTLVKTARKYDAGWLFCMDADERIEKTFSAQVPGLLARADAEGKDAFTLRLREMWNDRWHYRVDGTWGLKTRHRLFRSDPRHRLFDPRPLHRKWPPMEILSKFATTGVTMDTNIYHLRMIDAADRRARVERYKLLDPDNRFQAEGYDYLIDETGIELRRIPEGREFLPAVDLALT